MQNNWIKDAKDYIEKKTKNNIYSIGNNFPHALNGANYKLENPQWWTSGFWPGILWNNFHALKDRQSAILAKRLEKQMDPLLTDPSKLDHDMGFMWTLTSLARYDLTQNEDAKIKSILAATLLLGRFNSAGHYLEAWNSWQGAKDTSGIVIIDSMMNISLLYWASFATGDPRFSNAATQHAETIQREFIRADGSVYQMVNFDSKTGKIIEKKGGARFCKDELMVTRVCLGYLWICNCLLLYKKNRFLINIHENC